MLDYKVVFTYRDYRVGPERYKGIIKGDCELMLPEELEVFKVSLLSWKVFAPRYDRVMVCNESVASYLQGCGLSRLLTDIVIENFEQLDEQYPDISFFAAPKLWALKNCKGPTILSDTETVLFCPLSEWMKDRLHYGIRYLNNNPIRPEYWSEESKAMSEKLLEELGPLRKYCNSYDMINSGFTTWPSHRVANRVGEIALDICQSVCKTGIRFPEWWTYCEESILPSILKTEFKINIQEIFPKSTCTGNILEYSGLGAENKKQYLSFKGDIQRLLERFPEFKQEYENYSRICR